MQRHHGQSLSNTNLKTRMIKITSRGRQDVDFLPNLLSPLDDWRSLVHSLPSFSLLITPSLFICCGTLFYWKRMRSPPSALRVPSAPHIRANIKNRQKPSTVPQRALFTNHNTVPYTPKTKGEGGTPAFQLKTQPNTPKHTHEAGDGS